MDQDQAKKLREEFEPQQIGKLPRLTCKDCSQSQGKVCGKHSKSKCSVCHAYVSGAHIHLDYVGHAAVTDRLLQVDREWTWEPMAYGPNGEPLLTNGGLWIKLTVCGVTRPGFGDEGNGKGMKEIIGDAIRNAAMRFGVALDLWSKEDLHTDSAGEPEPQHGSAAAVQGPAVSQADAAAVEPASPAENFPIPEAARGAGQKATKEQIAEITSLVDVCALARGTTSDDVIAALENDGYRVADLRRKQAEELIGKLNRWASKLTEEAAA